MGLDMWLYAEKENSIAEIAYWRKHPWLHGWMEDRWLSKEAKSGSGVCFNCVRLYLDENDLSDLERDIRNWNLPETHGFFFGENKPTEESNAEDLEIIDTALNFLDKGYEVFYSSWW